MAPYKYWILHKLIHVNENDTGNPATGTQHPAFKVFAYKRHSYVVRDRSRSNSDKQRETSTGRYII